MRGLLTSFLLLSIAFHADADIVRIVGSGIKKEVQSIKQPIDKTIAYVGSSQCSKVKRLVGVAYEQIEGQNEPDLNSLTLVYKTRSQTTVMNITAAAEIVSKARSFDVEHPLIIFIHGFIDNPFMDSFPTVSEAFFDAGYTNVIALDGSPLIKWLYLRSSTYVRFMGTKLGELLAELVREGLKPSSIHIIGHSLGAHISSFAGKTFQNLTNQQVGRISGLDPAGPCFSHIDPEIRLKSSDAEFVDVMHTDDGVYGLKEVLGHVDFFPNSGASQPGCLSQVCSHLRAWRFFSESVLTPQAFLAVRCDDWNSFRKGKCSDETSYMGFPTKPGTKGLYFLQTTDKSPFGNGQDGIKFKNNDGVVKSVTNVLGGIKDKVTG